jgi:hypothetical protein
MDRYLLSIHNIDNVIISISGTNAYAHIIGWNYLGNIRLDGSSIEGNRDLIGKTN